MRACAPSPTRKRKPARDWLDNAGLTFVTGDDAATQLTDDQVLDQLKMYIAAVRIGNDYGCDAIGIQYQQGLKDLTPASDLVEGLLNNVSRPPVHHAETATNFTPMPQCRISMKWTSAPVWMR